MVSLPKRYLRAVAYFLLVGTVLVGILKLRRSSYSFAQVRHKLQDSVDINAPGIIINLGFRRCFHIGSWFRVCPYSNDLYKIDATSSDSAAAGIIRKQIEKDLLSSEHYNWFGRSEFLWYDKLPIDSARKTDRLPADKPLYGIHAISSDLADCGLQIRGLCVKSSKLDRRTLEDSHFLSDFTVLFGEDVTEPRSDWVLDKSVVLSDVRFPGYLSFSRWDKDARPLPVPLLKTSTNHKFKIVQLADLHFSVGVGECRDTFPEEASCQADPKTLRFISQVLDLESPDLVVLTGDQIMGDECKQDSETALLKVLTPVIARKIPWALVWGNHDDEGSMTRWQLSELAASLPHSMFQIGPKDTNDNSFGVGNYVLEVKDNHDKTKAALYFLDAHKYSQSKVSPGYDWIKEEQWAYMEHISLNHESIKAAKAAEDLVSMAFFHIPLPEYKNMPREEHSKRMVGTFKEGITAPKYNSEGAQSLRRLGVSVATVGHDHCNDYCLLDESDLGSIWLCYGGGGGEGGYAGYGGTERRIRIFEIDALKKDIYSWKRLNGTPGKTFDHQKLVHGGVPYIV